MVRKPFNEESKHVMGMDDFGEASDSCGEHQMNTDNGAGANANTSTNNVISMTSNPLSELVWSPETGISIKYSSDCNISTATTAVLWNAEKANLTALPQERNVNLLKALERSIDADIVTEKQSECVLDIQVHGTDDPPAHTSLNEVDQQLQGDAKSVVAGSQVDGVPGISSKKMVKKKGIWELEPPCKTSSSNPGLDDNRATDVLKKKEVCSSSVVLNNDICYEEFNQVNDHNIQVKVSFHGPSSDTPAIKEQNFNERPALDSMKYENNTQSTPPATSICFLDNIEFLSKDKIILRKSQSNEEVLRGEIECRNFDEKVLRGGMELKTSQSSEKVARGEMEIGTSHRGEKAVVETECQPSSSKRKADTNEDESNEEPTLARKRPFSGELECVSENKKVKTQLSSFVNWLSTLTHWNLKVEPDGELSLDGNLVKCHTEDEGKGYFVSIDKNQAAACASGGFENFVGKICSTNWKRKNLITEVIMDEITTSIQAQCHTNKQIAKESEHQSTVQDQGFSLCSLNPESPSQQTRSFESMTSYFTQRLAAIKNFVQVGRKKFCFFCGVEGHMLQTCKKFLQPEQEDIRKKLNLSDEVQDESFLCIRCFQLNHWAIACPHLSSENS